MHARAHTQDLCGLDVCVCVCERECVCVCLVSSTNTREPLYEQLQSHIDRLRGELVALKVERQGFESRVRGLVRA